MIHCGNIFCRILFLLYLASGSLISQDNTVGTLFLDNKMVQDGYTLLYPESQNIVYLIDNCGQWVHRWIGEETQGPGKEVYLLENGNLLRANTQGGVYSNTFGTGGAGGVVELLSWDNENLWTYIAADSMIRQHHDVEYMPNGNVMIIVWERMSRETIVASGFDTISNNQQELWPDKIIEVNPVNDSIVWEWSTWDHLIQDFDSTKLNYGTVSEHPELIDLNYQDFTFQRQDIHHINAIDYNPELDQVLLSVRNFNEVWIIDHSTTKEQAATHSGGDSGMGGDLLWRWGNPASYNRGTVDDQKLFRPHYSSWIDPNLYDGQLANSISVYNNFISSGLSLGHLIMPIRTDSGYEIDNTYLPEIFDKTYSHPDTAKNFSTAGSSIQLLENGNILFCAARQGRIFEINAAGELVWEYLSPFRNGFPIGQGDILSLSENFTFSAQKYPPDFPAFEGKDLSPKGYIELNPSDNCLLSNVVDLTEEVMINPNPTADFIAINSKIDANIKIVDLWGELIEERTIASGMTTLDLSNFAKGIYILILNNRSSVKIVKI